jgi:hypothetical protein
MKVYHGMFTSDRRKYRILRKNMARNIYNVEKRIETIISFDTGDFASMSPTRTILKPRLHEDATTLVVSDECVVK